MIKTWRKVILFSLILVAIELLFAGIFLRPYYKKNMVFYSIESGDWQATQRYYDALSAAARVDVQEELENYAVYICRQYIDGELDYNETALAFDAINNIDESKSLMNTYMTNVSINELKVSVIGLLEASSKYDTNATIEYNETIKNISQRLDNDTRESVLVQLMNQYYQNFLDGSISMEKAINLNGIVGTLAYSNALQYIEILNNNISCVAAYRNIYEQANDYFAKDNYFAAIELSKNVYVDEHDTKYKELFLNLYSNSYEMGKIYYKGLLEDYVNSGDRDNAIALMNNITTCYGEDFDLTDFKETIAEEWQLAYISLLENADTILRNDLDKDETGQYILQNEYAELRPDSLVLYDVDDDGVPEIFLFNSAQKDNDFIGCFIYTFDGSDASYAGYVNVVSFCRDSNLIGFPLTFNRASGDECSLVSFDGSTFTQTSYCQEIGGTYYVDGEETNDVNYLSARTSILSHIDAYNVGNSKGAAFSDGEAYILTY